MDGYAEIKKNKAPDANGKTQGNTINNFHATAQSNTHISFDKDDPYRLKNNDYSALRQDLNKSREINHQKKDLRSIINANFPSNRRLVRTNTTQETGINQSTNKIECCYLMIILDSATTGVLDQMKNTIRTMHQEINNIRLSMEIQVKKSV